MKKIITMLGFERNNIIAFYRRTEKYPCSKDFEKDWTQMQAIKVRLYWYEILYKRLPDIIKTCNRRINIYKDLL